MARARQSRKDRSRYKRQQLVARIPNYCSYPEYAQPDNYAMLDSWSIASS